MDGIINCMHSKLQLLFYDQYLRVVIPSGNLTNYDWGETGVMENVQLFERLESLLLTFSVCLSDRPAQIIQRKRG